MRIAPVVAISILSTVAAAEPRHLGVEDAIQLALKTNPRLQAAVARVQGGEYASKSVRSRMLPSVHVFDEYQHWDSAFGFPPLFPLPPGTPNVRDQDTNTFAASADQPLAGLMRLSEDYRASRATAEAGIAGLHAGEAMVRENVSIFFLRFFEAKAFEEIAKASEVELNEQVVVAEAKVKAGVLTNADVLRVQVAAANARQREISAHSQSLVARANIMYAVGLSPDDDTVILDEPKGLLAAAREAIPGFKDAAQTAAQKRPEIRQYRLQLEAADHTARARFFSLLPEIDAEAGYTHLNGQVFAPKDSAFIGVKANWAVWEWGASYFNQRAAARMAEAAKLDYQDQQKQIETQVATNLASTNEVTNALEEAEKIIASAEESYRVTDALLKAGSATTTDLLDSQSALTTARLTLAQRRYEQAISRVTLSRVIGE
jgi:outer membrane protein TolC